MVRIVAATGAWKRVQAGSSILSGLAGIEELSDYTLEDGIRSNIDRRPRPKKRPSKNKKGKPVFRVEDQPNIGQNDNKDEERSDLEDLLPWLNVCVPPEIARALVERGFDHPTEIQRLSIPAAIEGRRDLLGAAETGSGKTLAFGIPIIAGIMNQIREEKRSAETTDSDNEGSGGSEFESDMEDETMGGGLGCVRVKDLGFEPRADAKRGDRTRRLFCLVLAPTRELALQVGQHLKTAAKYTGVEVGVIVGGMSAEKQSRILNKKRPHIVVATPGRLWELATTGELHLQNLQNITYLAIDETDRMLEKDHFPELRMLLERIDSRKADISQPEEEGGEKKDETNMKKKKDKRRQNFVFSATLTFVHEPPGYLKRKRKKVKKLTPGQKLNEIMTLLGMTSPKVIDVTTKTGTAERLTESRITCAVEDKDVYLHYFLERHPGRTLVFCNSISAVRRLSAVIGLLGGTKPLPLHAQMHQRQRLNNLDRFKGNPRGVLLATDVAARGLDIPRVEHVVHYQVPRTAESYIHRSGRTARAETEGLTLLLVEPSEVNHYTKICSSLGRDKDLPEFPVDDAGGYARAKERVLVAREIDLLETGTRKLKASAGWMERAAKDMDIILDEDQLPAGRHDAEAAAKQKRILKAKRKKLKALLSRPLFSLPDNVLEMTDDGGDGCPPAKKSKKAIEIAKAVRLSKAEPRFLIFRAKK